MSEIIDNRAERIRTLKHIIQHLHAGKPAGEVKQMLQRMVRETDHTEIVAMEQELLAEGMPVEQLQNMCDLHSQVTREIMSKKLVQIGPATLAPGHPLDTFKRENEALRGVLKTMHETMSEIAALPGDADASALLLRWRQPSNDLMDIDKHYQRKEHVLFSYLEKHGITGPSKVMWAKDDEVRRLLKDLNSALGAQGASTADWKLVASRLGEPAARAVEEMIYKEENILLPMAQNTLTEDEWGEIWAASPRYGWCLVEPRTGYQAPAAEPPAAAAGGIALPTGNLSIEQLIAIFNTLPVDLTFVDADDRVAFFSEGPDRIFSRSKAIIGRKVQHCHPPRSVETVDRILEDFREGRQSVAEFWINFYGKFVHIRYFAVKDAKGAYAGTLEVTQEVSRIRALEGERRLLEYDTDTIASR
jgi:DUF438 domain-containing protein